MYRVYVNETQIGDKKTGKRGGGGADGKMIVAVAVEDKGEKGIGRISLRHLPDASAESLHVFIKNVVKKGSQLKTSDWPGYESIEKQGYNRVVI